MNAVDAHLPDVIAVGAWLKNAACRMAGGIAEMSALHGDLGDPAACAALEQSIEAWRHRAPRAVAAIAHDLHPDFFSTRLAVALAAEWGVPAIGVQHHHAHIAAVMAEHGMPGGAVGLALDGVGHGTDGAAWGGELLWVAPGTWRRLGHLHPLGLSGGDVAAREPWRMAASVLHALGRGAEIEARYGAAVGVEKARGVQSLLARSLRCPPTSSMGRWFDAAAAALGLAVTQQHEAEAAMALERAAVRWLAAGREPTAPDIASVDARGTLDLRPLLARLFDTPPAQVDAAAAWFHAALASALADWAADAARRTGATTVCLGGGCFFNAVLTGRVTTLLHMRGLTVLRPQRHSCGDAGLALGQAWAAAQRLRATATASSEPTPESLPCA